MFIIIYLFVDGIKIDIKVDVGVNVMCIVIDVDIFGIVVECGGVVMCVICYVYFELEIELVFIVISDVEEEMFECVVDDC